RLGPDLGVAIHARLGRRYTGETRDLHRGMAVTAVNSQTGDMVLVAERHRLGPSHAGIGHVGRALNLRYRPERKADDEDCAKNRRSRDAVRTAMKNLGHR